MNENLSTINPTKPARETVQHPSAEAWIAYYQGSLPENEKNRLQAHLAQCRPCVDLVLDLDTFAEPSLGEGSETLDFEKAAVWRTLEPALATPRWPAMTAIAASLIFATVGFSSWTQQRQAINGLETRVTQLSQPWANILIQDLSPRSRQRSAGGTDATTTLDATNRPIALILNLDEPVEYPGYEAQILDNHGTPIRTLSGLEPSEFDNFYIALPSGSLNPGTYELRLFGLDQDRKDLLEVYPIALR